MQAVSTRCVVASVPSPEGERYSAVAPVWFTALLRVLSAGFAIATAWLSIGEWNTMPGWVRVLVCILLPAFLWMALHPRGWARLSRMPFFVADARGMWFPSARNDHPGQAPRWLSVPWADISAIRVDKVNTADGPTACAAFDVVATPDEIREFFDDDLVSKRPAAGRGVAVAFYVNVPPHPKRVVERLLDIESGGRGRPS
jgi:hypothetical protein